MSLSDQPSAGTPFVGVAHDLLRRHFPFIHPDDRDWWIAKQDAYMQRLVAILHTCDQGPPVGADYRQILMQNVLYVYEFLSVYSTETGQAVMRQAAALLLTPTEYVWLAQDPGSRAVGLRRSAMGRYAPDIHERSQWELAQGLDEARGDVFITPTGDSDSLPMLGAAKEDFIRALAAPAPGGLQPKPLAMLSAAELTAPEVFWVCNSLHPMAESLRATWTRLRQQPESTEESRQFMRGLGLMRAQSLLKYEPSHLYQRLLLGQRPTGITIETADSAAACARSLTDKEANWIFTDVGPAARTIRASLGTLWGDPTWGGGLPDFTLRVATMREEGLVNQDNAAAPTRIDGTPTTPAQGLEETLPQQAWAAAPHAVEPPPNGVDSFTTQFPHAAAYLQNLPHGSSSYPSCQTTAEYTNLVRLAHPAIFCSADLPADIQSLFAQALPDEAWIGQTVANLAVLLVYDGFFKADDAAFAAWSFEMSKKLYSSPLNRALMYVLSPKSIVQLAVSRWGRLHRNSTLTPAELHKSTCRVVLSFPAHVFAPVNLLSLAAGYRAAIACAGGKAVSMVVDGATSTQATFRGEWSDTARRAVEIDGEQRA